MLPRARFRDHTLLSHAAGEQRLPHGVVDFMGTGVIQVLTLQIDLSASCHLR